MSCITALSLSNFLPPAYRARQRRQYRPSQSGCFWLSFLYVGIGVPTTYFEPGQRRNTIEATDEEGAARPLLLTVQEHLGALFARAHVVVVAEGAPLAGLDEAEGVEVGIAAFAAVRPQ